ncbi:MAG: hypothetical protein AB7S26_31095 [Sandaracinaceae bacterium]
MLSLAALSACSFVTPTQVIVVLEADPNVASAAEHLHIVVTSQDGTLHEVDVSLAAGEEGATQFPVRLPIVPRDGDASRTFLVVADVIDADGGVLGRQRIASRFVADELRWIRARFTDGCVGELCTSSTSCESGACADACTEPAIDEASSRIACPADGSLCERGDFVFCDDYEALPGRWESIHMDGGDISLVSAPAFSGERVLQARARVTDPDALLGICTFTRIEGVTTDLYARVFVRVPASAPPAEDINVMYVGEHGGTFRGILLGLEAGLRPFVQNQQDPTPGPRVVAAPIPTDRWVCLEGHVALSGSGVIELEVDGESQGTMTGIDTEPMLPITVAYVGIARGHGQPPFDLFLDDLVIDDAPIGCD